MNRLPKGAAWDNLVKQYPSMDSFNLECNAEIYGYQNVHSFRRAMQKRGIYRVNSIKGIHTPIIKPVIKRVPYAEIKLMPFKFKTTQRDTENMGIVISDWHLCKVTPDYNIDIARTRVDYLTESIMTIVSLHQPISKLWVFDAGDTVQGENPNQGSKIGETSHSAEEQIHDYAIPILSRMFLSLNQGVKDIEYLTVRSNHGKYGKEANPKTNWQTMMCRSLQDSLINQRHVKVDVPTTFYQLVNIKGFRFFLIHGHQVNASQGIPLFALRRKMQEWYALLGGFHYGYAGHFHTQASDAVNSVADYTIAPPLVTGDEWALEVIGRASIPKQLCFGIHEKYGRTFKYDLYTDDKYLPRPFNEPEGIVV